MTRLDVYAAATLTICAITFAAGLTWLTRHRKETVDA